MNLASIRLCCADELKLCGIERPSYEADIIISKVTGIERPLFIAKSCCDVADSKCAEIFAMVRRRKERVPLSYIIGEAEFYGYIIKVGDGCLIPRPETELLVEEMLRLCTKEALFADWCTGSGCIAIALLLQNRAYRGVAVDSSCDALRWAFRNRAAHSLEDRLELICSADPSTSGIKRESLDFITANPPYIPSASLGSLMRDVADYEPREALDGGFDGLDVYRSLFASLPDMLKTGGFMGVEIGGEEQCRALMRIAPDSFRLERKITDYGGITRHLIWRKIRK